MKRHEGYTWRAEFTHDRVPKGLSGPGLVVYVKARDEETAKMRAGLARAASFHNWFINRFFRLSGKPRWTRVSLERVN